MARVQMTPGLDEIVARTRVKEYVDDLAERLQDRAKRDAPPVKVWNTMRDHLVRPQHVVTDLQERPDNLRFELPSHPWDMGYGREADSQGKPRWSHPTTYLDHPGERGIPGVWVNIIHCRCFLTYDQHGIARTIRRRRATVRGKRVKAEVYSRAPFIIEAELGELYPGDLYAPGTHFMRNAARKVAAQSRGRRAPVFPRA